MVARYHQFRNLQDLKEYIYTTLCSYYQLQIGAYPMTKRLLMRGGRVCGMYFCLHGPRSMKLTAIWDTERNRILFYGSEGERILKTDLSEAPALECAAA